MLRRRLLWAVVAVLAAFLGYKAYTQFAFVHLRVVLPCKHDAPFLIAFGSQDGSGRLQRGRTHEIQLPRSGTARIAGDLPDRGLYIEWLEECAGEVAEITSGAPWQSSVGRTGDDRGDVYFGYICLHPANMGAHDTCRPLLEREIATRRQGMGKRSP
ncbi:MAG: hypothetical protein OXU20_19440 [Myxococcales bacterium]|nr:hypothetical protein [Myxococcales bacterium]